MFPVTPLLLSLEVMRLLSCQARNLTLHFWSYLLALLAEARCHPPAGGDDVFVAESLGTGILGQTSSSPRLFCFLPEFGKTRSTPVQTETRKRGWIKIVFLVATYYLICCCVFMMIVLSVMCRVDVIVASTAAERTGRGSSGNRKRQVRVQTANLQLAQLTVSGNKTFLVCNGELGQFRM